MKKIAIVNQRYGKEVNGGSEVHAMILAEHLSQFHTVEVITTTAKDYDTWANFYKEGDEVINGITVHRFPVKKERNLSKYIWYDRMQHYLPKLSYKMEQKWIDEQGPYCPDAIEYIEAKKDEYDVFIFVTYLYYLSVMGLKEVAEKSILIPTAHDERFLKMKHYRELFESPRGYFFNTDEERDMVYEKFHTEHIPHRIGGVGIEVPENTDPTHFKEKYSLDDYIVYVGRIDYGKNCHKLFEDFIKFKESNPSGLKLVLMGKAMIDIPDREDIVSLGFVSEEDKYNGMAGAKLLVLPSEFESMSIVVLDSMMLKVPVLVNGKCTVLQAHCDKSEGGIAYHDYEGFERGLTTLLSDEHKREEMGANGKAYVEKYYEWNAILERLNDLMDECIK